MAPSTTNNQHTKLPPKPTSKSTTAPAKQPLVCFSVAAYAKSVVNHLHSSPHTIPIEQGLTDEELASLEAAFDFTFPPDLRAILKEGLPVDPAFPNWRSSSHQQLRIILSLPSRSLIRQVSNGTLWCKSWGPKPSPHHRHSDVDVANQLLKRAPVLVPIYRNCYVPSRPTVAGNPVLYIDAERVRVLSCDITRFFCQEFGFMHVPVWAPKVARRIEFWSDVAAREERRGWWSSYKLAECLEEVFWRLREGGWEEEEVREMMMMDGYGGKMRSGPYAMGDGNDEAGVGWHVKVLSMVLLRGGWTKEDVIDSLGLGGTE
ncbi:hypothetical protein D8674_013506 [Pyrus ussuriensis x Pyrus communis]|uniref:Uncharacterized protein n=1 Tax=Pyrus ussuriensis x Pyrus communis TaxID=2448454 RepID=A0A5N5GR77_9ROSA|nr:hypothetical protein D8674_013506 [Pyrus ussuriensis x Pyrus communis]